LSQSPEQNGGHFARVTATLQPYWLPVADGLERLPQFECFAPPADLRGSVRFFWTLRCAGPAEPLVELVAPDADVDLIYRVGEPKQALIRGPQRRLTSISIPRRPMSAFA
jgi:hypothetical protein